MAKKPIHIFNISRHYTYCEVWTGSRWPADHVSAVRQRVSVLRPDKGLTRRERYGIIGKWLYESFGIPSPSYRKTKREAEHG